MITFACGTVLGLLLGLWLFSDQESFIASQAAVERNQHLLAEMRRVLGEIQRAQNGRLQ